MQLDVRDEPWTSGPVGFFEHLAQAGEQADALSETGTVGIRRLGNEVKKVALVHLLYQRAKCSALSGELLPSVLQR